MKRSNPLHKLAATAATAAIATTVSATPAQAQYRQRIGNDPSLCRGAGPAVDVTVSGIKAGGGTIRVQLYRGTKADWLAKGRWIHRIEVPASGGTVHVCMPVPSAGTYGIAVRHDTDNNGKTDLSKDGGGMSNNPSINIFNLGKPSYDKAAFAVGDGVKPIAIRMRYM